MKKIPNYLIILLLLATSMLLAACGTAADTASAAQSEAVEAAVGMVDEEQNDVVQEEAAAAAVAEPVVEDVDVSEDLSVDTNQDTAVAGNGTNGNGYGQGGTGQGTPVTPSGDLTDAEIADLLYMREEEKLAHDVYLTLYETWGTAIFSNIAASEQAHTDAVLYLIESYGLDDPAAGKAVGEFENQDLQALYNQLVAQGQESPEAALLVGGTIEEIDILDLQESIAEIDNPSLIQVFENLLDGSINHLNGFVRNYESQTGSSYVPQYMSQEAYEALIGTTSGQGNGPGGTFTGGEARGNGSGRSGRSGGQGGNGAGQSGNGAGQSGNGGGLGNSSGRSGRSG